MKVYIYETRCCGTDYAFSDGDDFDPAPNGICRFCKSLWTKGFFKREIITEGETVNDNIALLRKDHVVEIGEVTKKEAILLELNTMMSGNEEILMTAMMSKFYGLPAVKCDALMQGKVHLLSMDDIKRIKRRIKETLDYKAIIL